jgi:hypothetical protein
MAAKGQPVNVQKEQVNMQKEQVCVGSSDFAYQFVW